MRSTSTWCVDLVKTSAGPLRIGVFSSTSVWSYPFTYAVELCRVNAGVVSRSFVTPRVSCRATPIQVLLRLFGALSAPSDAAVHRVFRPPFKLLIARGRSRTSSRHLAACGSRAAVSSADERAEEESVVTAWWGESAKALLTDCGGHVSHLPPERPPGRAAGSACPFGRRRDGPEVRASAAQCGAPAAGGAAALWRPDRRRRGRGPCQIRLQGARGGGERRLPRGGHHRGPAGGDSAAAGCGSKRQSSPRGAPAKPGAPVHARLRSQRRRREARAGEPSGAPAAPGEERHPGRFAAHHGRRRGRLQGGRAAPRGGHAAGA
eukprot:scaffold831_cov268-Pinguiococcus_pyrenoidosus.AAC.19